MITPETTVAQLSQLLRPYRVRAEFNTLVQQWFVRLEDIEDEYRGRGPDLITALNDVLGKVGK